MTVPSLLPPPPPPSRKESSPALSSLLVLLGLVSESVLGAGPRHFLVWLSASMSVTDKDLQSMSWSAKALSQLLLNKIESFENLRTSRDVHSEFVFVKLRNPCKLPVKRAPSPKKMVISSRTRKSEHPAEKWRTTEGDENFETPLPSFFKPLFTSCLSRRSSSRPL